MEKSSLLIARILLAHMFILAGIGKISNFSGTQQYMEAMGVAGGLIVPVIMLEIGGGLLLLAGWFTRWTAIALGVFCILTAAIFHTNFADQIQMMMFMKNLTIAGGMIVLAVHGAGEWSVDPIWNRWLKQRHERAVHEHGDAKPT